MINESRIRSIIRRTINEDIEEHEKDFKIGKKFYKYHKPGIPHRELSDFRPKIKPLVRYKQFKMYLDPKTGENLTPGVVYPLYINTEDDFGGDKKVRGGLKLGVWYKSGAGECWINTENNRLYTRGGGYGVDKNKIGALAFRPGWHLTNTPWGNQRGAKKVTGGKKGTGNNYRNTWDADVWAKVEICVDIDATEMAKEEARRKYIEDHGVKLNKNGEQIYNAQEACFQELGDGYSYQYRTNTNATDDQTWYIVDKIRIVELLDDDTVDAINDEYYGELQKRYPKRKMNSDPEDYTQNSNDIPYWKMPRVNGKRYSKKDLLDMGYAPQDLTKMEEEMVRRCYRPTQFLALS